MRHATMLLTGTWLACALVAAEAQTPPAAAAAAPAAAATDGPTEVVQGAAQGILGDIDRERDAYRRDPAKLAQLVDKYLLPRFDIEYAARGVLGQYWRTATPEQRQRFISAFYHSLLNNYGNALIEFSAERLKIFPTKVEPDATRATVRTEIKRANGDRVSVNYYLHKTPQGWRAWDVVIDGISYVNSYRTDFGEQIEAQGIDSVIKRLESGESPGAISKQKGK